MPQMSSVQNDASQPAVAGLRKAIRLKYLRAKRMFMVRATFYFMALDAKKAGKAAKAARS